MAEGYISSIKLPDNKEYLLKDSEKTDEKVNQTSNIEDKEFPIILKNTNDTTNEINGVKYAGGVTVNPSDKTVTAQEFIGNIKAGKIIPTIKKTYTDSNFYGTTDSEVTCCKFFISVKPDGWYKPWQIRFKVRSYCPGYANVDSVTWCTLNGRADALMYANWNERYDTGHYYIMCRPLKNAGFNNGLGHAVGVNIRYGTGCGNSAYYRTIELDYYDCENCTVTVLDNAVLWENWTNGTDTNYNGWNNLDAVNRGLRETGDDNDTGSLQMHNGYFINNSSIRMPHYTLFGFDREGKGQAISLYQADYTSGTVSINTNRVYNTKGIDYTRGIYYNSGGNYAINAIVTVTPRIASYACDFRYTDNCVASGSATTLGMVREKPVYFRGTINDDGLFYLAPIEVTYNGAIYKRAWVQDIPTTADGYVYWFIGYPYYNSSYAASLYQINLYSENPLYWFHNGRFEEYKPASIINLADVTNADDLKAIEAISDTTGLLKKTAENTWVLDTNNYVTSSGITSVTIGATSPVQSSTSTAQNGSSASTTISLKDAYGDTKNPYGAKAKNLVLVGPASGNNAAPTFRTLVAADIPDTFTRAQLINTEQMAFTNWLPKYGSGTAIPAKTMALFADGLAIKSPATSADAGWIRVTGTDETDTVLEIATSDDANKANSEKIVVRQYNGSSAQHEAILLGKIEEVYGATSFPVQVQAPKFLKGTSIVPDTGNTTGTLGSTKKPIYSDAGVLKEIGYTIEKSVPSDAVFTDHYAWGDITSKPDTATRWPKWNEISQSGAESINEGTSDVTDNTEILTSYASNNGFADTHGKGVVYRRDAIKVYNYIKGKLDSVYAAKATTLSGYGITDAASSNHSHTLKIGNKSLSVSTSEQTWSVHDILLNSTSISTNTSWDQTAPGSYYVASSSAFTGIGHPGTNQEAPYAYGGLYVLRAGNGGAAQIYISHNASNTTNKAYGIRYRSGWNVINNTEQTHWVSWATILDDKNYSLFAWKRPASITTGQVLVSNGNDGTTTTRAILNNTKQGALGWNSAGATNTDNLRFMTVNTLAYWNGAYSGTSSNLSVLGTVTTGIWNASVIEASYIDTAIARLASPTFTGEPKLKQSDSDALITNNDNSNKLATTAFVKSAFKANDAMEYKGVVNSKDDLPADHTHGWTYRIGTAGEYAGVQCEIGDMIICNTDGTSADATHWNVIQNNIDGAVIGPANSTENAVARFVGNTGKIIQSSAVTIDNSNNLTVPGTALKITNTSGAKFILMGNQDSSGANKPTILQAANGTLYIGNGTDWSSNTGGTLNTALYMSADRKIGIGTVSPSELLHITGNLLLGNSGDKSIYYQGTKAKKAMISFLDNTADANGNGIKIGGGGTVVVGAGESAANLSVTAGNEILYLTSDGAINIEAGGDTIANRIGMQVTTAGHIIPVKAEAANNNVQNLGASDNRWATIYSTKFNGVLTASSWIDGQRYQNGAFNIADYSNKSSYNPWMRATNTWSSGTEDEKVGHWFSFGTLGTSFYWMGSTTTRTENSYDHALRYNVSTGKLYCDSTEVSLNGHTHNESEITWSNNTLYPIGDDIYIGDVNIGGHLGLKAKNASYNTGLIFIKQTTSNDATTSTTGGKITWDGTKFSITSTTAVDASISGNAATATTATNLATKPSFAVSNTNNIKLTIGDKTSDEFTVPYATSAGSASTATYIKCSDTRNVALNPTDLDAATGVRFDFKAKATIDLTATDGYAGVMSFRPYAKNTDWSGGPAHQLAFNSEGLHWRSGGASWSAWNQILDNNNYTTYAVALDGSNMTAAVANDLYVPYINTGGISLTDGENIDKLNFGTYYARSKDVAKLLNGIVPSVGAGFKLITIGGYLSDTRYQFAASTGSYIMYRTAGDYSSTNPGWTQWKRIVYIGSNEKTTARADDNSDRVTYASFSAVGDSNTPVYVTAGGAITACTPYADASVNYATSAGSATKAGSLSAAVTLWGNSFDGSADIDGTITLASEKDIVFRENRKKDSQEGWAHNFIRWVGQDNEEFMHISVYGTHNALAYLYIGNNNQTGNNLRIAADGSIYIPVTTASTSVSTGAIVTGGGVGVGGQVTATRLAANGSNTSYNLYVNGNALFNIGTSDSVSDKRFLINGNNRALSIGGRGLHAYNIDGTEYSNGQLNLQYYGGNMQIGNSGTNQSVTGNVYGNFTYHNSIIFNNKTGIKHIEFTRQKSNNGPSYICYPESGELAIGYALDYNNSLAVFDGNTAIRPGKNNTFDLGASSYKWADVYATTFNGSIKLVSGNTTITNTANERVSWYEDTVLTGYITIAKRSSNRANMGIHALGNIYIRPGNSSNQLASSGGVVVSHDTLYSGTNEALDLGTSSYQWKDTYSKSFIIDKNVTLQYNSTDDSLDFIFA